MLPPILTHPLVLGTGIAGLLLVGVSCMYFINEGSIFDRLSGATHAYVITKTHDEQATNTKPITTNLVRNGQKNFHCVYTKSDKTTIVDHDCELYQGVSGEAYWHVDYKKISNLMVEHTDLAQGKYQLLKISKSIYNLLWWGKPPYIDVVINDAAPAPLITASPVSSKSITSSSEKQQTTLKYLKKLPKERLP